MKSLEEIKEFEKIIVQLNKMINDFYDLSKKKPDESLNPFKLGLVNSLLKKLNAIMDDTDKPFTSFSVFTDEEIPSNSDVLVVLNQYHECAKIFAWKNVNNQSYESYWLINGKKSSENVIISRLFGE